MAGFRIEGNTSGNIAEVDSNNNIRVILPGNPHQLKLMVFGSSYGK